jgi:RNA polymerase sigma-70 factor (ECF subfamily)
VRTEEDLVRAAKGGDRSAFDELATLHRDRLRLHCYRMLGSFHDAEDAVQDALLKAWRSLSRFEGRSGVGTWLHRIATTTCLNMIRGRPRVVVPARISSGSRPAAADVSWLEPYPDIQLPAPSADEPEARILAQEATRLAFVEAVQLLPGRQRAVLLLRDVLMWSAAEVAEALDTTVPAVNSALQRARARLAEPSTSTIAPAEVDVIVEEFVRRWGALDIEGIVAMLTDDAVMAMPPAPAWFLGPSEIGEFFATVPAEGRIDLIRLVRTWANGQPAVAAYMPTGDGGYEGYGVMVFEICDAGISGITGFQDPQLMEMFGLPDRLALDHR